jgi:ubiquinone/menaquinone biosynthesis C-methylase UbiE
MSDPPDTGAKQSERTIRNAYETGAVYDPSRICRTVDKNAREYVDRLLHDRFQLVAEYYAGGRLVDLCCATGAHLVDIAANVDRAVGVDFSGRYLAKARELAASLGRHNVELVQADARQLPFAAASVRFLYCFSSLYAIPRAQEVVAEIGRVLEPNGRAVLDFGNRRSLNAFCLRYYTEWPAIQPLTVTQIRAALKQAGLEPLRHRRFQLLPLWADRPAWLWPLLHPIWKGILKHRVGGRMLDEWVSSLPVLRGFAFRHVVVCRKTE